ncbi:MAG: PIG-L deacetylase family protein [Thermoplasmata archaeon]
MFSRILILAPHTDDGELGCGGTITKFVEEKADVWYAAFSAVKVELEGFPEDALKSELEKAMKVLGVSERNVLTYGYQVRQFSYHRQQILDDLVKLRRDISPDIVLMPSLVDLHQDHKTIAEEGRRAFKKDTILGYEQPWNNISFNTVCFVPLEERHVERKLEALACYETQQYRTYLSPEFIRGLARTRGTQIEKAYAEAFEVVRWVMD